jgi:excisionase family DNA binding protein
MNEDLTSTEAARILSVHPETLNKWAEEGHVPYWTTPGGQRRYRRDDIEALREPSYKASGE